MKKKLLIIKEKISKLKSAKSVKDLLEEENNRQKVFSLLVLFADPLMFSKDIPYFGVSFEAEINEMKEDLMKVNKPITFNIDILTENFLANFLSLKPEVLHYIGHGGLNTIAMEDN